MEDQRPTSGARAAASPHEHQAEIVVGVDGSKASWAALDWAAREAVFRGGSLKVVLAWQEPAVDFGGHMSPGPSPLAERANLAAELQARIASVLDDEPFVPVVTLVKEGPPAKVLLEEAADADLLVVGSRGLGGFMGLLLGSVSSHVVHHAPCPVTIVHAEP